MVDTRCLQIVRTEDAPEREDPRTEIATLNQILRELLAQPTVGEQPHWEQIATLVGISPARRAA